MGRRGSMTMPGATSRVGGLVPAAAVGSSVDIVELPPSGDVVRATAGCGDGAFVRSGDVVRATAGGCEGAFVRSGEVVRATAGGCVGTLARAMPTDVPEPGWLGDFGRSAGRSGDVVRATFGPEPDCAVCFGIGPEPDCALCFGTGPESD